MSENSQPSGTEYMDVAQAADALEAMLPDEGEQESEAQTDETADEVVESEDSDDGSADAEESEESGPEEEGDDSEEEQQPTTVKVKVDGEEVEVTLDELKNGYSRTRDYTKKTQEVAAIRKQTESELQAVSQERQQYSQLLGQLAQQIQAGQGQEPDWEFLAQHDPIEYSRQWTDWQRSQQKLQVVSQEQQRVAMLNQERQAQQMQQMLEMQRTKLIEALPTWSDPEKAKSEKRMVMEQGKKLGYTEEELAQAYDHRAIVALRKAALYDELMSKRQEIKPVKATQKVVEPGSKSVKSTNDAKRAQQQLRQSGKVQDAAKALQFLLN